MKVFVTGAGGFIGGSIAAHLARSGHAVRGLVRRPEQFAELEKLGITPVPGDLDDRAILTAEARAADAVINAASSDHRGAVQTLLDALDEGLRKLALAGAEHLVDRKKVEEHRIKLRSGPSASQADKVKEIESVRAKYNYLAIRSDFTCGCGSEVVTVARPFA